MGRCLVLLLFFVIGGVSVSVGQSDLAFEHSEQVGLCLQAGDYAEAERLLEKEGKLSPEFQAFIRFQQGRERDGLEILESRITRGTPSVDLLLQNATLAADSSKGCAQKLLEEYKERFPVESAAPAITLFSVRIKLRLQQLNDALQELDPVLASGYSGEKLGETLLEVALALESAGKPLEGRGYLDKLFELKPEASLEPGYQLQWAHLSNASGKYADALMAVDKIESNYPDFVREKLAFICIAKGTAFEKLGQRADAASQFRLLSQVPGATATADLAQRKLDQYRSEDAFEDRMKKEATAIDQELALRYRPLTASSSSRWLILAFGNIAFLAIFLFCYIRMGRKSGVDK